MKTITSILIGFCLVSTLYGQCDNVVLDCSNNDDVVVINPYTSPANFTIMAWFKSFSTPNGNNEDRIFSFSTPRLEIGLGKGASEGLLWVYDSSGGGTMSWGSNLHDDTWHHVALTRSGSNRNIYLDGQFVASWTGSASVLYGTWARVGRWHGGGTAEDWFGQLDDIRVYDRAMTLTEILDVKDCAQTGNEPNLNVLLDFEDGTPAGNNAGQALAMDASGNGNNGTLHNFNLVGTTSNFVCASAPFLSPSCGMCSDPIANCTSDFSVDIGSDGTYDILMSDIDSGSTADCGVAAMSITPTVVTCADGVVNPVTLVITDVNGMTASCTTVVSVDDPQELCCIANLVVNTNNSDVQDGEYIARNTITSNDLVPAAGNVVFNAGTATCLDPGFEVALTAEFCAIAEGCCNITNGLKIIESLGVSGTGIIDIAQAGISLTDCNAGIYSLSFSDTNPNMESMVVDCSNLGISNYTVYLWIGNVVVEDFSNLLQVLDPFAICI